MQTRSNFCVTFDEKFIDNELADTLLEKCNLIFGNETTARSTMLFGKKDLAYTVTISKKMSKIPAINWELFPELLIVKQKLENITGENYNFCAINQYPNGRAVIPKHRDREIKSTSQICGVSLGTVRRFKLSPMYSYDPPLILHLNHGSLYALLPPTNDHWVHEILPDDTEEIRYSLTFRNILNPLKVDDIKYCNAILKSGQRKGEICGNNINNLTDDYCGRHKK
jgi:alkylated DNA repair dioxygenase AlkB